MMFLRNNSRKGFTEEEKKKHLSRCLTCKKYHNSYLFTGTDKAKSKLNDSIEKCLRGEQQSEYIQFTNELTVTLIINCRCTNHQDKYISIRVTETIQDNIKNCVAKWTYEGCKGHCLREDACMIRIDSPYYDIATFDDDDFVYIIRK